MKRKFYSTFAIAFGLVAIVYFHQPRSEKFVTLGAHSHERMPANANKARAPIASSVVRLDDGSTPGVIELQGTVKAVRDFRDLKAQWGLPAGVEVVSGSIEQTLSLAAGETQSFVILVKSKTSNNRKVFFSVQTTDQPVGENYGATAQYNTTRQELIAKQLKENFLKAKEQVRSGELRKIIF